ncbi:MAG: LTA synthase family protein [Treponema sp.]|jgi:phosphoglycerol transferase|nr:LTA synthase family protein [Treponema sp.]
MSFNLLISLIITVTPGYFVLIRKNNLKYKPLPHKLLAYSCFFIFVAGFYLNLYSFYRQISISKSLSNISENLNIKYLAAVCLLNGIMLAAYFIGGRLELKITPPPPPHKRQILIFFHLFLLLFIWSVYFWFKTEFDSVSFETLMYYARMPLDGTNWTVVTRFTGDTAVNSLIFAFELAETGRLQLYRKKRLLIRSCMDFCPRVVHIAINMLLGASVIFFALTGDVFSAIKRQMEAPSSFYEENYIDPEEINFSFTGKKRNLIVIFIESLETGFLSGNRGGAFSEDIINELALLAQNNINFSHTNFIGGSRQVYGTGWTIAGIVSTYTGIPLTLPFGNNYGKLTGFLPGITSLGDILYKNGYSNYFILGSDSKFAGRNKYFKTHGNTTIWDYTYFHDEGYIDKDYRVWWGFEDRKLYRFAKDKLSEIAAGNTPFFFTLLTVDTHPADGYLDDSAEIKYTSRYKNVLADMSGQLLDFINWIRRQGFYDNTTIAILGDHLYMDSAVFQGKQEGIDRRPLNIFINSMLNGEYTKNREFTHFDLFPAIIDSIGAGYNAAGIGLGRSMNKGEKTLIELLGPEQFETNLKMKSNRYESFFK